MNKKQILAFSMTLTAVDKGEMVSIWVPPPLDSSSRLGRDSLRPAPEPTDGLLTTRWHAVLWSRCYEQGGCAG